MTARTRLETGIARGWPLPPSDVAEVLAESDAHRTRADASDRAAEELRGELAAVRAELAASIARGVERWGIAQHVDDVTAEREAWRGRALAAEAKRIAAEADRDALRAECERAAVDAIALEVTRESMAAGRRDADVIEDLTADRDAALAVIAGREVAPTDSELTAHAATGGGWLVSYGRRGIDTRNDPDFARITRDAACPPVRWWPLDRSGAPTAWPTVTP